MYYKANSVKNFDTGLRNGDKFLNIISFRFFVLENVGACNSSTNEQEDRPAVVTVCEPVPTPVTPATPTTYGRPWRDFEGEGAYSSDDDDDDDGSAWLQAHCVRVDFFGFL